MKVSKQAESGFSRRLAMALEGVRKLGLLERKTESVAVRLNPDLLRLAKARTGLDVNSAVIEMALANLVIEDAFPEAFAKARGSIPSDLRLEV